MPQRSSFNASNTPHVLIEDSVISRYCNIPITYHCYAYIMHKEKILYLSLSILCSRKCESGTIEVDMENGCGKLNFLTNIYHRIFTS